MITSISNETIKHIKSLYQKKYRDEFNEYIVEGIKLVKEAINEKQEITKIVICEELMTEEFDTEGYPVELVNKRVFDEISDTQTPQGVLAVIKIPSKQMISSNIIFALDDVRDPGNIGTIIRTLDCAGLNDLILSTESVDIYNSKVVRSTMGAIFRVNVSYEDLENKLLDLQNKGYEIIITDLDTEFSCYDTELNKKCVVVIGNEAHGVSDRIKDIADKKIRIPMYGRTESLNASVAAGILIYESVRQNNLLSK